MCSQAISPELIILRVARGKAWKTTTTADLTHSPPTRSTLRFATTSARTDHSQTVNGARQDGLPMTLLKDSGSMDMGKESV